MPHVTVPIGIGSVIKNSFGDYICVTLVHPAGYDEIRPDIAYIRSDIVYIQPDVYGHLWNIM